MAENGAHFSGEGHLIEAVILGDPNKTVIPVVCDAQGRLVIDLSSASIEIGTVDQGTPNAGGAQSWPVAIDQTGTHNVVRELNVDKNFGTWSYYAGISGTVTVAGGQRVLGIAAHATTAGTVTINGGPTVTLPAGVSWELEPLGNLVAPIVVFTSTDTYFIEVVS